MILLIIVHLQPLLIQILILRSLHQKHQNLPNHIIMNPEKHLHVQINPKILPSKNGTCIHLPDFWHSLKWWYLWHILFISISGFVLGLFMVQLMNWAGPLQRLVLWYFSVFGYFICFWNSMEMVIRRIKLLLSVVPQDSYPQF